MATDEITILKSPLDSHHGILTVLPGLRPGLYAKSTWAEQRALRPTFVSLTSDMPVTNVIWVGEDPWGSLGKPGEAWGTLGGWVDRMAGNIYS